MKVPIKIGNYLVKKFIFPFIIVSLLVVFLYIIQEFVFNINKYMKMDLNSLVHYFLYWTPYIYMQMFGVAMLFSTIYVISSLNSSSELLAIHTNGISTFSMSVMLIIFIFFISVILIVTQDSFVIDNFKKKTEIERKFFPKEIVKDNVNITLRGSRGNIYYVNKYLDKTKELIDVRIIQYDNHIGIKTEIIGKSAKYINKGRWLFYDVYEYQYDLNNQETLKQHYVEKEYNLFDEPELFQRSVYNMELLHIKEGWQTVQLMKKYNLYNYIDEFNFWAKFVFPISGFLISLFGIAAGTFFRKNTLIIGLISCIIIYGSYYFIINILYVLGKRGIGNAFISALIGPIIFLILGIYSLVKVDKIY
ncbi:MAG TPA: LptF/LptG family permease [Exilispira sp.]|nr:LptF/LptG family permease [Exilispira sp.]